MTNEQLMKAARQWKVRYEAVCMAETIADDLPKLEQESGEVAQAQQCPAAGKYQLVKSLAEYINQAIDDVRDNGPQRDDY